MSSVYFILIRYQGIKKGSFANVGVWLSGKSFPASITVVVGAILFAQQ